MSALPVDTAMSGMLSVAAVAVVTVPGSASDLSACGLSLHAVTLMFTCLRHLPICRTSGTLDPTGTLGSEKLPSRTPVDVLVIAPLLKSAAHEQASAPVGTPFGSASSGTAGT